MKRLMAMVLLALLVLMLAGCNRGNDLPLYGTTHWSSSDPTDTIGAGKGIYFSLVEDLWVNEQLELTVLWTNDTDQSATYGLAYRVEYLSDGAWIDCPTTSEPQFAEIACLVEPHSTREEIYQVMEFYDISNPGFYRLVTECYTADTERLELYAQFQVMGVHHFARSQTVDYGVQYIRTNDSSELIEFPAVCRITSRQELEAYCQLYQNRFYLERQEKVYADTTIGFLDACNRYDDAFFEENQLIFLLLEESSGSIRHQITGVQRDGDELVISLHRQVPEVFTCDMAQWHVMLELPKDTVPTVLDNLHLEVDGQEVTLTPLAVIVDE